MLDRTVPPPVGAIKDFSIPNLTNTRLSNGAELYYANDPELEVVKIEIHFRAGRWYEKQDGSALFLAKLLKEGTRYKSSLELNQILESNGAFLEANGGQDRLTVTVYSLIRTIDEVLMLVNEILTSFEVREDELEKLRDIQLSSYRINVEKTGYLAGREFRKSLFGKGHPYGKMLTEDSISSITERHIIDHFDSFLRAAPFSVICSGAVTDKVLASIDNNIGSLSIGESEASISFEPSPHMEKVLLEKEGAVQSTVYVGKSMPTRTDADTHRIAVVNEILGGYFGSRLMSSLREDQGLTYGVHSRISHLERASYSFISADVIKESKDLAVESIHNELNKLSTELVGDEELNLVKNYMLGSLMSSIDSVFSVAQLFRVVYFNGMDLNFFTDRVQAVKDISSEDVLRIANQYFKSEDMLDVIAG